MVPSALLCRPEHTDEWEYVIWLDVDPETMLARARARDVAWVGSEEVVVERYRQRVIPSHLLYEALCQASRSGGCRCGYARLECAVSCEARRDDACVIWLPRPRIVARL